MLPRPDPPGAARLIISSDPCTVRDGLKTLVTCPPLDQMSVDFRGTAELVLAEVLNNIVEHAYSHSTGLIDISVEAEAGGILCRVVDEGVAMPDGAPPGSLPARLSDGLDDLPEGGFGWHLIRTLTVDLTYRRKEGRNYLFFLIPA